MSKQQRITNKHGRCRAPCKQPTNPMKPATSSTTAKLCVAANIEKAHQPRPPPRAPALILPQRSLRARTTTKANSRGCTIHMSALAVIAPASDAIVSIPVKTKRIPKRIAEVVHLLVTGECKTIKAAAERTGMHPNYVSGALKKPEIQVFIERSARQTISAGLLRASARVNELVDASSEHVSFEATKHVLAIAGIKPTADAQVSVNIDIKAGYVIDLTDDRHSMKSVGPIVDGTHD